MGSSVPGTYYTLVIVSRETDQIVGSGGVFIKREFLRGLARARHIEDIVVARMIQALTHISDNAGCYKAALNFSETNVGTSMRPCQERLSH